MVVANDRGNACRRPRPGPAAAPIFGVGVGHRLARHETAFHLDHAFGRDRWDSCAAVHRRGVDVGPAVIGKRQARGSPLQLAVELHDSAQKRPGQRDPVDPRCGSPPADSTPRTRSRTTRTRRGRRHLEVALLWQHRTVGPVALDQGLGPEARPLLVDHTRHQHVARRGARPAASRSAATTAAAIPAFMSLLPRPCIRPSRISGTNASGSAPTTSVGRRTSASGLRRCRAGGRPRWAVPARRPTPQRRVPPPQAARARMRPTSASPAPPGTSVGWWSRPPPAVPAASEASLTRRAPQEPRTIEPCRQPHPPGGASSPPIRASSRSAGRPPRLRDRLGDDRQRRLHQRRPVEVVEAHQRKLLRDRELELGGWPGARRGS